MVDLKVLMLVNSLSISGGVERVCSMLANNLSDAGYEIVLATLEKSNKPFFPINKDIEIISVENSISRSSLGRLPVSAYKIKNIHNTVYRVRNTLCEVPSIAYKIRKILKKERIDTVIAVDTNLMKIILPATLGLPVNLIGWEHMNFNSNFGSRIRASIRQSTARYCDSVITLTERDKEYWLKGTCHKSQITAIANPCPFPVQEYIQHDTKTVLAVGRLHIQKGFELLLESWLQVIKIMPEWRLKIVGEGEERAKLTAFIEKNKLAESVELVGITDDISEYYRQAEIFCLSSRFEGFPMVLLETLAFGLPVVSFDCETGPAEILENTGSILVPNNDVDKFALSLIELMKDDEQRKTISLRSKEKAKIYQPEKITSQWIDILESFGE